jgi:hypothetical protein
MRLLAFLRGLFPRFFPPPVVRWEDGTVSTDPRYAVWYAETVARIRANCPDIPIQSPDFRVTVRIYDRWPIRDGRIHYGKVLAPNVIQGDTHGTLCMNKPFALDRAKVVHENKHCITGEPEHPKALFPELY